MQVLKEAIINAAVVGLLILTIMQLHSPDTSAVALGTTSIGLDSPSRETTVAAAFDRHPLAKPFWLPAGAARSEVAVEPLPSPEGVHLPRSHPAATTQAASRQDEVHWVHVAGSSVNLRSAPGVAAARVTSYPQGKRLELVGRQGNWAQVRDPETGTDGWMAARYVTEVSGAIAAETPASPDT